MYKGDYRGAAAPKNVNVFQGSAHMLCNYLVLICINVKVASVRSESSDIYLGRF